MDTKDWLVFFLIEAVLLGLAILAYQYYFFGYIVCILIGLAAKDSFAGYGCDERLAGPTVFITFAVLALIGQVQFIRVRRKQWERANRKR